MEFLERPWGTSIRLSIGTAICCEAGSACEALAHLETADPLPDLMLVDIALPDRNGLELIKDVRAAFEPVACLAISMHDEELYAERVLRAGGRGYIMKEEPSRKLISAIRKILNGEIYISDKLNVKLLHKFVKNKFEDIDSSTKPLSNRELEVYQLIGRGLKKHEIAKLLNISVKTVETYIEHIKIKLQLKGSHDVLVHALKSFHLRQ